MTREERLRMLLHPERYTDKQLAEMLDEVDIHVPDIETEWQKHKDGRRKEEGERPAYHRERPVYYKVAAAIIGVLMLSGISYAAISHLTTREHTPDNAAPTEEVIMRKPVVKQARQDDKTITAIPPIIYNNMELQKIMQQLAKAYGVKVRFKNEAAKSLRFYLQWEADDTLGDIIEKINHFEKVHLTLSEETITIE